MDNCFHTKTITILSQWIIYDVCTLNGMPITWCARSASALLTSASRNFKLNVSSIASVSYEDIVYNRMKRFCSNKLLIRDGTFTELLMERFVRGNMEKDPPVEQNFVLWILVILVNDQMNQFWQKLKNNRTKKNPKH